MAVMRRGEKEERRCGDQGTIGVVELGMHASVGDRISDAAAVEAVLQFAHAVVEKGALGHLGRLLVTS